MHEMNETIIRNYNERVKPEDVVYHLGDFCFKNSAGGKYGEGDILNARDYEKLLNGKLILVAGNHDSNNSARSIIRSLTIKYGGKTINLVHRPDHVRFDVDLNFVGHVHEKWLCKRIYHPHDTDKTRFVDCINVGVDQWNFRPITFNEITTEYYRWKNGART